MGLAHIAGEVFTGFANVFSFSRNVFTFSSNVSSFLPDVFTLAPNVSSFSPNVSTRTDHVSSGSLNTQSEGRGVRFDKAARNGVGGNPWTAVGSGRSATVPDQRWAPDGEWP